MKKYMFAAAAAALLTLPVAATAQANASASGTVVAKAKINAVVTVTKLTDLDFGTIAPGSGSTVTPGTVPTGAGQSMGALKIDFNSGASIAGPTATGLSLAGAPDLPVAFSCGYSVTQTGALSGSATACSAVPNLTYTGTGGSITRYLQVGGSINSTDTSNRIPGTYTANLQFTVTSLN